MSETKLYEELGGAVGPIPVPVKTRLFDPAGPISLRSLHEKVFVKHSHAPVARSCDPFLDYLIQSQTRKLSLFDGVFAE